MITTVLTRALAGSELRPRRAAAVTERNIVTLRGSGSYWWLVISGVAEPLFYLLAIGWGVGALVGEMTLPDGRVVPYLTYLAPALVAASAMNGAIAEATFNFFARMKFSKLYDSVLNSPVTPVELAFGELAWATIRGTIYIGSFLVVMVAMDVTTPVRALVALPAGVLVGFAFSALGIALATILRTWQDFDYIGMIQFGLFLFSGTFVPVATFPVPLQVVVQVTPLYHGVELLRAITTGAVTWASAWHVLYLIAVTMVGIAIAGQRLQRKLHR
jgi:lipooligosaccharide transport system permease protein